MREKLSKFFEKDGFYFILFICVCIVAIAAVMASRGNLKNMAGEPENEGEDFIILESDLEDDESIEIAKIEENRPDESKETAEETAQDEEMKVEETEDVAEEDVEMTIVEDEDEYVEEDNAVPSSTSEEHSQVEDMIAPVIGSIGTDYTEDNLIYSETLDKWTAHQGVDIMAAEGTQVMAALSGTVQEVYEDPLWGIVVIISHGDNLLTKYASLSEDGLIEEGAIVNKGDVIGRVGKTAAIEMLMEPHVHYELIEDGISINPNIYLPSFMYSN